MGGGGGGILCAFMFAAVVGRIVPVVFHRTPECKYARAYHGGAQTNISKMIMWVHSVHKHTSTVLVYNGLKLKKKKRLACDAFE